MQGIDRIEIRYDQDSARGGVPAEPRPSASWFVSTALILALLCGPSALAQEWPPALRNEIGMEFALIPAGTFRMGEGGMKRFDPNARPAHQVTISKPFYIGKYEVTQGEWEAVMGENPSHFKECGARCPVESISWDDAIKFIEKLNAMEGSEKHRLPTEAEWEYAARGGQEKKSRYGPVKKIAWTRSNGGKKTHPVGEKAPNGYGLFDTLGNVAEWVQDWFGKYSKQAQTDPVGPEEGEFRVRRGSCQIGGYKLGLNQGCRVEHRGLNTSNLLSDPIPIAEGPVSISIEFKRSKPPASDRGVGFRLLRTAP